MAFLVAIEACDIWFGIQNPKLMEAQADRAG